MKKLVMLLCAAGFTFQYIIPAALFGGVFDYTHAKGGLTKDGIFDLFLLLYILCRRLRDRFVLMDKGLKRGIILSLFPIAGWIIINCGIDFLQRLITDIAVCWDKIIIFIILGRAFYVGAEIVEEGEENEN